MQGANAFCIEPGPADGSLLLHRLAWDHSRILNDRSHGSHPLEITSTETLTRCP